ncbi:ataxin-2-like protein isoform X1 [Scleropages formosus]|uniref:ataxin-2-like protein isoform X1 n=1 Tax=Scleropages formosus TaxID=113540 RepID=UPI00087874E8|nr:ataxin-2-like protein isoform X1 [Scleropages formosus]
MNRLMLKQHQPSSSGRKALNGTSGPAVMSSMGTGTNASRVTAGRSRNSVKPPSQVSPVFDGVYNNARMLHFLTAVVGSTCDIRVKNGSVYEGIFKTLSSRCELAVDAVHRRCEESGGDISSGPPRREEITDTMVFSPSDLVTMTCRDVDLNFATRDSFTDSAISSSRVNGEHREKVLQRWDGGDSNGDSYELEADASNGWDANEMFRYNEENYGIKSTYDSSLSMYTMPLEKGNSEGYRQREARATRIANEIESSPQYRHRLALENEDGKTEEEKYSAVVHERDSGERERGQESPNTSNSREGKYVPIPQRVRDMGISASSMRTDRERERASGGGHPPVPSRVGGPHTSRPTIPNSTSKHTPPSPGCQPAAPSERNSPHQRGGASAASPFASTSQSRSTEAPIAPATSPPASHPLVNPEPLFESPRPVNGLSPRMSPKAQRPTENSRNLRASSTHVASAASFCILVVLASRSPKSTISSQDSPPAQSYLDTTSVTMATAKPSGPAPLFPVDVNEILSSAGQERTAECATSPSDAKSNKVQHRSQIEELRKFGKEFRLQASGGIPCDPSSSAATPSDTAPLGPVDSTSATDSKPSVQPEPPHALTVEEDVAVGNEETVVVASALTQSVVADRQSPLMLQPIRTPGGEEARQEVAERAEEVIDQVKRSTLNPNAKEFNPSKVLMSLFKPTSAPTPPRHTPNSPSVLLQTQPGQGAIYSSPYLSYMSPIQIQSHSVQAPQVYHYMSTVSQGKYPRAKGSVVTPRPEHSSSAPPMLQAGPSLVASPYPQSYLQYGPQQYGQQVLPAMGHYPGQPMYSMLQSGTRMLGSGGHAQALGPAGPPYPGQSEGPPAPQPALYAPQSFSHHPPQPSSTPTGSQPPQHTGPAPGQSAQAGPQAQSLYGPLSAPTPPNMPPGHTSPQGSYPLQGYSLHGPQPIHHTYPSLGQLAQAHVPGTLAGPHHSGTHGGVMLLHAPSAQQAPSSGPQHPQHAPPPQQGAHPHYAYIGPPSAVQVQAHAPQQLPFHPPGN